MKNKLSKKREKLAHYCAYLFGKRRATCRLRVRRREYLQMKIDTLMYEIDNMDYQLEM